MRGAYVGLTQDCDGVLWAGAEALPGVASVLNKLRQRGKRILFVTNNATKSRRVLLDRIVGMGIEASKPELFSSAYATALYLRDVLHFPADRKVYVVGMAGLEEELRDVGIHITGGSDPADHVPVEGVDFTTMLQDGVMDPAVAGVVCGLDTAFTYCKMAKAMRYLTRPGACEPVRAGEQGGGCHFVCTNEDVTFPSKAGAWPGAGSVWAGIAASSKRAPIVIGKPNQPMIDTIFERYVRMCSDAVMTLTVRARSWWATA